MLQYFITSFAILAMTGDMVRNIPLDEILFFETALTPHHVLLHTASSRIDFLGSLNELKVQLSERFLRIHRAYLAAVDKIEEVDLKRGKLRIGGQECLVSRSGKVLLRKKMGGSM